MDKILSQNICKIFTYTYDHQGQRLEKARGTGTTTYASGGYEVAPTGVTKYIYAGGELVATIAGIGTTTTSYIHRDHLSSTNVTTNQSGGVSTVLDYYPYGSTCIETGTPPQKQYIGQYDDSESDLAYLNARYYDPTRGQFTSQDPMHWAIPANLIIDPQLQNSYGYARNNPIIYKDATGELAFLAPAVIGGVLGAVGGFATQAYSDWTNNSFSGLGSYAVSTTQGAVIGAGTAVAGTVVLAYGATASLVASGAAAGTLTAGTSLAGNYIQNKENDYGEIALQSTVAAGTAGVMSKLPKVPGAKPKKLETILTGRHAQRAAAEEAVTSSNQLLTSSAYTYYSNSQSSSRSNSTSRNYDNAYRELGNAQRALERGDLNAAKAALNRANSNLNRNNNNKKRP